ncbi:MAG: NUDIX hydrolase [Planctomycetaceae bacterium]|nr:NUDIX hydrolase [Planctomycetaceae bacterium]
MDGDSARLLETRLFHVVRRKHRLNDGSLKTREVICHPGAVTIVPMVDNSHVCLIRNYRLAVEKTLIELPAGTLEPGENPEQTAIRELEEETGFRTTQLQSLHSFYLSPGILDEQMHLFVATELTAGPARREPGEQIENHIVSWPAAMEMVHDGTIQDAKTLVGLLLYERLRR